MTKISNKYRANMMLNKNNCRILGRRLTYEQISNGSFLPHPLNATWVSGSWVIYWSYWSCIGYISVHIYWDILSMPLGCQVVWLYIGYIGYIFVHILVHPLNATWVSGSCAEQQQCLSSIKFYNINTLILKFTLQIFSYIAPNYVD